MTKDLKSQKNSDLNIQANDSSPDTITRSLVIINIILLSLNFMYPDQATLFKIILFITDAVFVLFNFRNRFYWNHNKTIWLFFVLIIILSTINSILALSALVFIFSLILFFVNSILLESSENWRGYYVKILTYVISFFVLGSILQLYFSDVLLQIQPFIFSGTNLGQASNFVLSERLVGFTNQTGINGFILSVALGIILANVLTIKKGYIRSILSLLYLYVFVLLIFTDKRGFILYNLFITIYLIILGIKNKLKATAVLITFVVFMLFLTLGTEFGQDILMESLNSNDITSGRSGLNSLMWNDFLNKPIFGNGTFTTNTLINFNHGHNIYLQVLREHGLLGFIPLVLFLIKNLIVSNNVIKNDKCRVTEKKHLILSIYLQLIFILWGFTGNPLYDNFPLYLYFVGTAILYSIKTKFTNEGE